MDVHSRGTPLEARTRQTLTPELQTCRCLVHLWFKSLAGSEQCNEKRQGSNKRYRPGSPGRLSLLPTRLADGFGSEGVRYSRQRDSPHQLGSPVPRQGDSAYSIAHERQTDGYLYGDPFLHVNDEGVTSRELAGGVDGAAIATLEVRVEQHRIRISR